MYYDKNLKRPAPHPKPDIRYRQPVSMESLGALFADCGDFEFRRLDFGLEGKLSLSLCWLDGLVSGSEVAANVIRPLTQAVRAEMCIRDSRWTRSAVSAK